MIPAQFDYEAPRTLSEALHLLASNPEAKILAGGHSLLPAMKLRLAAPALLVDLGRIAGLSYIRDAGNSIAIGAMTTHADLASSALVLKELPLLAETAEQIGDVQVRNRGTIGGSLAHADPAADYPAAILALDGDLVATGAHGERSIAARDFFTGMFSTSLEAHEILTEIRIAKSQGAGSAYRKFRHPASGFAVVGVAAVVQKHGAAIDSVAVGITGVGQSAYRASAVERALRGNSLSDIKEASKHAADGIEALGDHFASAEFRKHLACVYTQRALLAAAGGK
jgi:carbon-monoxide dehydrogenase medium subunit